MIFAEPIEEAELVESFHAPWCGTVGDCLQRWSRLDPVTRSGSYLVLRGASGVRHTLKGSTIAEIALRAAA